MIQGGLYAEKNTLYIRQTSIKFRGSDAEDARQRSLYNITRAASLAHHGLLGKLKIRSLHLEEDLSSVPVEHLTSLISIETMSIVIRNVSGCDLVTILASVKCDLLYIQSQHLGTEETQALVQAMESGVSDFLGLGGGDGDKEGEMSLDIEALVKYSGEGKCYGITCLSPITRYREELKSWAEQRNWILGQDDNLSFVIFRQEINN